MNSREEEELIKYPQIPSVFWHKGFSPNSSTETNREELWRIKFGFVSFLASLNGFFMKLEVPTSKTNRIWALYNDDIPEEFKI